MDVDDKSFKQCPTCNQGFSIRDIFEDPTIRPLGLALDDSDLETNLYFLNHQIPGCGTTFIVPAVKFTAIVGEAIPEKIRTGQPDCEGHCNNMDDWRECKNDCLHAPFRRLLVRMEKEKKAALARD